LHANDGATTKTFDHENHEKEKLKARGFPVPHFLRLAITPPFHLYLTNGFFHQSTGRRAITGANRRTDTRVKSRKREGAAFARGSLAALFVLPSTMLML
jgi:hypothetical protein